MLTTLLDLVGVICLATFTFLVWPPLALVVLGVAALFLSWTIEQPKRRRGRK